MNQPTTEQYGVVFVPVPAEMEAEVMKLVTGLILSTSLKPWDAESMTSLLEVLDDEQRAVLMFTARARAEESRPVSEDEVAEAVGLTVRGVRAVARELEELAGERSRAMLILQRPGADGPLGPVRDLMISMPFARLVVRCAG